jgi:hypothetical protein
MKVNGMAQMRMHTNFWLENHMEKMFVIPINITERN